MSRPDLRQEQHKKSMGKIAFDAYREAVGLITFDNKPIPQWEDLGERQKIGWRAAANAVARGPRDA